MTHEEEIAQLRAENAGLNNLLRALALTVNELLRMFPLDVENESVRRARDVTDEIISAVEKRQRGGHAN